MRFSLIFFGALLVGCNSTDSPDDYAQPNTVPGGVYILNEGEWQKNNSSLQWVYPQTGEVVGTNTRGIWDQLNWGDTGNFLSARNDTGAVVVSGSNRIDFFLTDNGRFLKSFFFGNLKVEPREIISAGDGTWWVSSFERHSVIRIRPSNLTIVEEQFTDLKPEHLIIANGYLWVSATGWGAGTTVNRINLKSNSFQAIEVGLNPARIVETSTQMVVLILDNPWGESPDSRVVTLNKVSGEVTGTYRFGETLYSMDRESGDYIQLQTATRLIRWIPGQESFTVLQVFADKPTTGSIVYEMSVDTVKNVTWLTSINNYTSPGWLEGFRNGERLYGPIQVGINPGSILWNY
ncbi:MAG: hypothetical protein HUU10_14890 [Bacteroidetes bacterium]|nr:hypothetical protein [Bacteroidota bacterium]